MVAAYIFGRFDRWLGIIMLLVFAAYMSMTIYKGFKNPTEAAHEEEEEDKGGSLVNLPAAAQKVLDRLEGGSNASYAIRFAANYVEEDCRDYDKVGVNLEVFRAFAEGFLSKTAKTMTDKEVETLALSCFVLTAELATRFLADYLDGDLYFKTNAPDHNLVRTRCQIALAKDMLKKMDEMNAIVRDCVNAAK